MHKDITILNENNEKGIGLFDERMFSKRFAGRVITISVPAHMRTLTCNDYSYLFVARFSFYLQFVINNLRIMCRGINNIETYYNIIIKIHCVYRVFLFFSRLTALKTVYTYITIQVFTKRTKRKKRKEKRENVSKNFEKTFETFEPQGECRENSGRYFELPFVARCLAT